MISYIALHEGGWGLAVKQENVEIGQTVNVLKKDGTVTIETVQKFLFQKKDMKVYSIVPKRFTYQCPLCGKEIGCLNCSCGFLNPN